MTGSAEELLSFFIIFLGTDTQPSTHSLSLPHSHRRSIGAIDMFLVFICVAASVDHLPNTSTYFLSFFIAETNTKMTSTR